jgi:nitroreductase
MTNAVIECILSGSAAAYYDLAATMSDDQIRELVQIGTTAPTSFHWQNWRFIAVRPPEAKARLSQIARNQPATTDFTRGIRAAVASLEPSGSITGPTLQTIRRRNASLLKIRSKRTAPGVIDAMTKTMRRFTLL